MGVKLYISKSRKKFAAALAASLTYSLHASSADFPIVFDSAAELRAIGIVVLDYSDDSNRTKAHRNECYYYGDGGYNLSISDEFLASYQRRGFSKRSLCMGLVSGIRYNPETGQRLPTYMVVRASELGRLDYAEPGTATEELPAFLPDCFKRGLPYTDCNISYGPMSGRKFNASTTKVYAKLGRAIENQLRNMKSKFAGRNSSELKAVRHGDIDLAAISYQHGEALLRATFSDFSSEFPEGFGYALNAWGDAGPSPSMEAIEVAQNERNQANRAAIEALKKQVNSQ